MLLGVEGVEDLRRSPGKMHELTMKAVGASGGVNKRQRPMDMILDEALPVEIHTARFYSGSRMNSKSYKW